MKHNHVLTLKPLAIDANICSNWAGPLFQIGTSSSSGTFTFNGNGKTLNGQGTKYWDGKGGSGGVKKPVSNERYITSSRNAPFINLFFY
jgi:hypothetical protein